MPISGACDIPHDHRLYIISHFRARFLRTAITSTTLLLLPTVLYLFLSVCLSDCLLDCLPASLLVHARNLILLVTRRGLHLSSSVR